MLMNDITDVDDWALAAVFDIWLANVDRVSRNLMVEPMPIGTAAKSAVSCRTWWIDHGWTGLMPPAKFGTQYINSAPEDVDIGAGLMDNVTAFTPLGSSGKLNGEQVIRDRMAQEMRNKLTSRDDAERQPLLDQIMSIDDDEINGVFAEVPESFMSSHQADLTCKLLKLRRDSIEALVKAHW